MKEECGEVVADHPEGRACAGDRGPGEVGAEVVDAPTVARPGLWLTRALPPACEPEEGRQAQTRAWG